MHGTQLAGSGPVVVPLVVEGNGWCFCQNQEFVAIHAFIMLLNEARKCPPGFATAHHPRRLFERKERDRDTRVFYQCWGLLPWSLMCVREIEKKRETCDFTMH